MINKINTIEDIREFNRFFTVLMDGLNLRYLDTEFSITEFRVLYELNLKSEITANQLIDMLKIDKSYMSRILKKFEKNQLISKESFLTDKRFQILRLTSQGQEVADQLINLTNHQIEVLIEPLSMEQCCQISNAMKTIMKNFKV
ncbi:MarR family winged helix-turn-helix transcriptional regulator [Tetragenococcus koreensis]|nr:MarR family winged helix-turn-helix transcriptional regulator [Tetragenococcus koreensis]MDN6278727.1 MarR family winged helix-turn-helix transcriptional regulator [Lactococcus lactis]MCF1622199.1 MarR family winged helix-turn-helix transcriptional regulator [Tetragenococcus koreensis]MCF1626359.1 MarR family winged helix-turn-helix transcriptional regulator [Tetragenococcus koreensis]MCF1678331.1 MarR family winged helix-turn-helix transcriptional regulator [Tetragenococcus koreensis]MCF16